MRRARVGELLGVLAAHEVEFVVVGMTAGVLQGAPVTTLDLDVLHRRSPANVDRLLRALGQLGATYRHDPRGLRPAASHLASEGHQLLTTSLGDLDCLGSIENGRTYEDVLPETVEMRLSDGATVRVLGLAALIETKERTGRPKDLAVLPLLRATLDESRRRGGSGS